MKTRYLILGLLATLYMATSCGKMGAADRVPFTSALLTGESLASTTLTLNDGSRELQLHRDAGDNSYSIDPVVLFLEKNNGSFGEKYASENERINSYDRAKFCFFLDVSGYKHETVDQSICPYLSGYWDIPSEDLFAAFGNNKEQVKKEYYNLFNACAQSKTANYFSISTILYNGGITLTANKEYAGVPAGENLASFITASLSGFPSGTQMPDPVISSYFNTPASVAASLGLPLDYISMTGAEDICFTIPKPQDCQIVQESVTFELKIPVKVVLLLSWLNDRLDDENAPVPCREEELHCTFTVPYRIVQTK